MIESKEETLILARDTDAIGIPSGLLERLSSGTAVTLVHQLGGDFTVRLANYAMYRVAEADADALGKESLPLQGAAQDIEQVSEASVWARLHTCYDPEIPVNIVDLGLVYALKLTDDIDGKTVVDVTITLTSPMCPMGQVLVDDVKRKVETLGGVAVVNVELTFEPPWDPSKMTEAARLEAGMF